MMTTVASCLYEGTVRHRRFAPVAHEFRQRLFLMYLDLSELPDLFKRYWLWSADRPNLAWFRRVDHLGSSRQDLSESVRDLVEQRSGFRPGGPIRLLTHLRYAGFLMNPISLFYCFDRDEELQFVVAEVNNTPWNERHCYVLDVRGQHGAGSVRSIQSKQMHVSPFLGMNYVYRFLITQPREHLAIHIENHDINGVDRSPIFDATLSLRRQPINGIRLLSSMVRFPFMTAQVYVGIYWQAYRLWRKGVPYFPHPDRAERIPDEKTMLPPDSRHTDSPPGCAGMTPSKGGVPR